MSDATADRAARAATADGSGSLVTYSKLKTLIGNMLTRAHATMRMQFLSYFAEDELSPTLLGTLSMVVSNSGRTQSSVAREFGIDRSAIVGLVDRLEKRQLVERQANSASRRVYALRATAEGRRVYAAAIEKLMRFEDRMLAGLSARERKELARLLAKLIASWQEP